MSTKIEISISTLQIDSSVQQRVESLNQDTVEAYVEAGREGWNFPPVVVFVDRESGEHWLADGFHRVEAARRLKRDTIPARLKDGDKRSAILYAAGANATHGQRRSNSDKRKAIKTLLEDPEWQEWSSRKIAKHCHVDPKTVEAVRQEMSECAPTEEFLSQNLPSEAGNGTEKRFDDPPEMKPVRRRTANGRTIDTANISAANRGPSVSMLP